MPLALKELQGLLDELLKPEDFRDYCPNGLQIEGNSEVRLLISGVTACQALIDEAITRKADALLVHHGYFWRGEDPVISGIRRKRIKALLDHEISLFAYHLPLDAHPVHGNNACLGKLLGFSVEGDLDPKHKSRVGVWGKVENSCDGQGLINHIKQTLGRAPFHVPGEAKEIKTIAWCTGAAQQAIELAHSYDVDAYLTGEVSEQTVHFARETGMHFFAAGHHATERYGVQSVGQYISEKTNIEHQFIDIDNPV